MPKLLRPRPTASLAALLAVAALGMTACSSDSSGPTDPKTTGSSSSGDSSAAAPSSSSAAPSSTAPATPAATTVKITTLNTDGATYGVGMPVIVYFSRTPKEGRAWQEGTKVTANGKPLTAAWYFEQSSTSAGPVEAHLRPQNYWPAHAKIHVDFPKAGTSLGGNMVTDGKLTSLDFQIGARNIATVNNSNHTMTVTSDGKEFGTFEVSLGAPNTPTKNGIKVIMEKGKDISMRGPGYFDPHVKWTQRLTYGGEYLHAAPWNCTGGNGCEGPQNNIGRANSSNGCTNLTPADAKKLYGFLDVGDVVTFPNATGPKMQLGQGYGDWNVSWGQWQTGGLVSTT